ncbi:glycosyltransferase family protein [Thalassotalea sp. 1_MG-2023]|uniref:MJ1255/VC2487 family glycosyltransferase n=1 Tax=Thalassotalea sp. 1_MG-2023 TaxID=3062680 RepID=UPI0026E36576|nr:MJ1255/VC2487 family glycosyltransferase [Thalassotalea sp. 1_MG-2023]MDO6428768.1 glycosyltransferase family protein [Thalassotalea sp. 1_MG-2023]
MKILYGIQATGNGHISRSRVMAKYFKERNIEVTYLLSGREKEKLFDMEVFGDYLYRRGLTFVTHQGKINHWRTIKANNIIQFVNDIRTLNVQQYDLVITDFEPITAWAAKLSGVNSLAIGHQYAFGENTPIAGENVVASGILKYFAPAKQSLGLHWARYNDNVLPPIIDVTLTRSSHSGPVLVYLPFEDQQAVTKMLNLVEGHQFVQYAQELTDDVRANVRTHTTSYQGFKQDLKRAQAVICNSGFELNSECIHLGIPILTKPIAGQMEQESNALALEQLGYGKAVNTLTSDIIEDWLIQLPSQTANTFPDVAQLIIRWLSDKNNELSIEEFTAQVWQQ